MGWSTWVSGRRGAGNPAGPASRTGRRPWSGREGSRGVARRTVIHTGPEVQYVRRVGRPGSEGSCPVRPAVAAVFPQTFRFGLNRDDKLDKVGATRTAAWLWSGLNPLRAVGFVS